MDLKQFNHRWLALQVRPKYEFITANILRCKGYEEFLPVYISKRKWSDRIKEITTPLFTGYVFCKMDENIQFPLITTPGVIRIVGSCGGVAYLEDSEIEAIRMAEKSGRDVQPWTFLHAGDRVQISAGPLSGLQGVLLSHKNKNRLIVSVNLIQSSMAVEINGDDLMLLAPPQNESRVNERALGSNFQDTTPYIDSSMALPIPLVTGKVATSRQDLN
ncbi:MAG TPA: transcription termination/antitermination NusG family protein [Candidatus Angelobacter sp.]|nr:transcription termination/antitermination NusG family protein [Candidatus Angelobacter sp.]